MFKTILTVATLSVVSTAALAAENNALSQAGLAFSGNVALTSDYRYRGITQTNNDPAVQGGFSLKQESGVYAGVWGSNVGFASSLELDPYLGYSTELPITGKPVLDVGVWYYGYPSASDSNWAEYYARLTFPSLVVEGDSLFTNINYADDFLGDDADGDQLYVNAVYSFPLADTGFGGVAGLGYTKTSDTVFGAGTSKDYLDWKVGVNYAVKSIDGFTAELAAIGTDIDTKGYDKSDKRAVETGAVFTLTKAF
ncbi:MAG: hypothetical protein E6Q25_09630 [Acinetobacter sp.]|jgi:uncharacterized protein (TIGR02001 family)|nr:MAG: hypothetical protein E6Q25_09630 [Acinetobacter sp.]